MKNYTLFILLITLAFSVNGQKKTMYPDKVVQAEAFMTTIPLSEMEIIPPSKTNWKNGVVPNKTYIPPNKGKSTREQKNSIPEQALQKEYYPAYFAPDDITVNINGIANSYGVAPPDPSGDVGPNHYVQMVNMGFQIFNKAGTALTSPADLETIWTNLPGPWVGNYGDPIVLYDEIADRWFLSQFSLPNYPSGPYYILIAVSETSDPTGSYHLYSFLFDDFPDYPKFGVWPDGYYMSINQFAAGTLGWAGAGAAVFERSEMLLGNAATMIFFNFAGSDDPWSFLPSDLDGPVPPSGTPNSFTYIDHWSGTDRLRFYDFTADWGTTSNSTFVGPTDVNVELFNATASQVPQALVTQTLDVIDDRLMNRLQYRNFGTYQTLVTNHTVDAGSGRAGIRWYELRNTGSGWSIFQESTYAPTDGEYRWMGSAAMNANGDIALGYSVSSSTIHPSIRFTGRMAADPVNQMTLGETTLFSGTASQSSTSNISRWGDYSSMSVDPSNNNTFWYTQEYTTGGWNWATRISSFSFGPPELNAQFAGNPLTVIPGNNVLFNDMSTGTPGSWNWTFEGGVPPTFDGQTPPPVSYASTGLFDVILTVTKDGETDTETKLDYINVANCEHCPAEGIAGNEEWISNVMFITIDNSSGPGTGYTDYTAISTDVLAGSTHNLEIEISSIGTFEEFIWAFFDFNADCDFDDPGESFNIGETIGPGVVDLNILIPENAVPGPTTMRLFCKYADDPLPCENFSFGEVEDYTINIIHPEKTFGATAFLEGPFNGTDMNTDLNPFLPLNQPFNEPPWNYAGGENVPSIPNPDVVDWILIDLRDAPTPGDAFPGTSINRQAGFLLRDGSVVGLDGSSDPIFTAEVNDGLFPVLHSRNHIPIISNVPVPPSGSHFEIDFSSGPNQAFGGPAGHKEIGPGVWGLRSGDSNRDGFIDLGDKSPFWDDQAGTKGYHDSDFNFDAEINNIDKDDYWFPNQGMGSQVPN